MDRINEYVMKTLLYFVSKITDSGGVSRVLSLKVNFLADVLGYKVHIISTNDTRQLPFFRFSDKVKIHFSEIKVNGFMSLLQLKKESKKKINEIQPDIVLVTDNGIKGLFIREWVPDSIPCIYELHASLKHFYKTGYQGIKKYMNNFFIDKYLSKYQRVVVLRDEFVLPNINLSKQLVIPNPLSFYVENDNALNHKKAIAVGRLISLKGYDRLLSGWKKITDKHSEYVLDIFGEASEEYDIHEIIASYNLQKNVYVFPPTAQIKEKYLEANFLLHGSFSESFGMVFLEAMQCCLPIVYYDDIGNSDFLNERNSFGVANEAEFVEAADALIKNSILRKEMGQNAKQTSDLYKLEIIMSYWDALFREIK